MAPAPVGASAEATARGSWSVLGPAGDRVNVQKDIRVNDDREPSGRPLWRGPIIGAFYFLAGVIFGVVAWLVGGWVAVPLWIIGVLMGLAGIWTAVFTGAFLILMSAAKRLSGRSESSPD
jgi:hypothetical protein